MLNLIDILSYYPAHISEGHEVDILKEYLQYFVLDSIFQSPLGKKMCFIGGTALRLLYNNQRFSEDLDFDNAGISFSDFLDLQKIINAQFALHNINAEFEPIHKEAYHLRVKLPNILYEEGLSSHRDQKIKIRIDTHNQGLYYQYEQLLLKKFEIGRIINVAPISVLMAMKIITIPKRKKAKGRDYYDLIFLMNKNIQPDIAILQEVYGIQSNDEIKNILLQEFGKHDAGDLFNDVRNFLFNAHDDSVLHFATYVENYDFMPS